MAKVARTDPDESVEAIGLPAGPLRVADFIVEFLHARGVDTVFLLTGNGAMYLNDAIQLREMKYYCARNEAAAPMMAESYARLSGKLGVVCVTSGPGSSNAVAGLAEAWVDSAPIMIISGQAPREQIPGNDAARKVRSFGTASIDIISTVKPITKYAVTIDNPKTVRYHLEKAYHLALTGRPGPVWIDIPMDVQYAEIEPDKLPGFTPNEPEFTAKRTAIEKVLAAMSQARRPLIVAGQGVRQSGGLDSFKQLVERAQVPVFLSRLGQDLLPYSHPCNLGQGGRRGVKCSKEVMADADFVLALGCRLAEQLAGPQLSHFSPDATIAMVDIDTAELAHLSQRLDIPINADVATFMASIAGHFPECRGAAWNDWLTHCQDKKATAPMVVTSQRRDPIDLYHFMSRLDALADDRHSFITDAGSNYYVGGQVYHFENGQREITSGAYAAMGLSIPLAIGAAVARPEGQILAVTGDGSLELNIQELKTLSYYGLNVKLFVINNGGYVSMRNWQDQFFEGRRIGSDKETGAEMLDLRQVASAFDIPYDTIRTCDQIDEKLRAIIAEDGPLFVEVVCDPNQQIVQPFTNESASSS